MFAHRFVHAVKFDEMKRRKTSTRGTVLLTIRGLNVQAINLCETDSTVFPQQTKSCVLRYHCFFFANMDPTHVPISFRFP